MVTATAGKRRIRRAAIAALMASLPLLPLQAQQRLRRILGVFDDATGLPIVGAEVIDTETGAKAVTSASGVVTLAFLRPGTSLLQVRSRLCSPRRAPPDTVWRLELSGFYDRRRYTTAPQSAFVTAEQMARRKVMYLGDVENYNGRGVCRGGTTYVNGSIVQGGVWLKPGDSGSKLHIDVEEVAGIETYKHAPEIPAEYNRTGSAGAALAGGATCVTLIWLK